MLRLILGVVVGAIAGMLTISVIEMLGHVIWPPPTGVDMNDMDAFRATVAAMPTGALAAIVAGWTIGAFVGALAANLIAQRALAGWIVAALVIAAIIVNATMIPGPSWMPVSGILLALLAGWLASRVRPIPF